MQSAQHFFLLCDLLCFFCNFLMGLVEITILFSSVNCMLYQKTMKFKIIKRENKYFDFQILIYTTLFRTDLTSYAISN